jgi:hypothetical protein
MDFNLKRSRSWTFILTSPTTGDLDIFRNSNIFLNYRYLCFCPVKDTIQGYVYFYNPTFEKTLTLLPFEGCCSFTIAPTNRDYLSLCPGFEKKNNKYIHVFSFSLRHITHIIKIY